MLKKIKKILPLLLVVFLLIPLGSAFGAEGGLIAGKTLNLGADSNLTSQTTNAMTDGDLSSNGTLSSYNLSTDTAWYQFSNAVTIDSYQLYASGSLSDYMLVFYDSNGTIITSFSPTNIANTKIAVASIEGVQKVAISNYSSGGRIIQEIDFFGVSSSTTITKTDVTNITATDITSTGAKISWSAPTGYTGVTLTGYQVYNGSTGSNVADLSSGVTSYNITGLSSETSSDIYIKAKYSDGTVMPNTTANKIVITTIAPVDTTPTGEVTNINGIAYTDKIDFTFTNPTDSDFKTVHIYNGSTLIGSSSNGSYSALNLEEDTSYSFVFKSEDTSGNITTGVPYTISTTSSADVVAPSAPTGLAFTSASNGGTLTWTKNTESDVQGYNIYVDGVKYNATPVSGTSYQIIGLEVDTSYQIQVTAVDTSGNESTQSTAITATADIDAMPILKMGYDLKDVAEGTGNWFSSLWLIIAFAVAIPLAFYVSNRIKLLFLS